MTGPVAVRAADPAGNSHQYEVFLYSGQPAAAVDIIHGSETGGGGVLITQVVLVLAILLAVLTIAGGESLPMPALVGLFERVLGRPALYDAEEYLRSELTPRAGDLTPVSQERLRLNPMRLLDAKDRGDIEIADGLYGSAPDGAERLVIGHESVGRVINVLVSEFQRLEKLVAGDDDSVVHGCPPDGSGLTPCCHRSPIDLPLTERISLDGSEVTCKGAAAQS